MEWGTTKGLAVRLADETDDIRARAAQQRQAQALQEHKAAMFADDMAYTNVMNSHDNPLVKQEALNTVTEMGRFMQANPGWETNPMARAHYNSLKMKLKSGPDFTRGALSDKAYADWQKDMATNPDKLDAQDWNDTSAAWGNYLKYGNQAGQEAATKYGKQAFQYLAPTPFNGQAVVMDTASKMQQQSRQLTNKDYKGQIGLGATYSGVDEARTYNQAQGLLKDNKTARGFSKEWANVPDTEKQIYGNDISKWLSKRIQGETGSKMDTGAYPQPKKGDGNEDDKIVFHYLEDVYKQPNGATPHINSLLPLAYDGLTGKYSYKPSAANGIKVLTSDGKTESLKKLPGMVPSQDYESAATGQYKTFNGVKYGEIRLKVPVNQAMTKGPDRLFEDSSHWFEGFDANEENDLKEIEGMNGIANLGKDVNGKPNGYAYITTWEPLVISDATIQEYNNKAGGVSAANKEKEATKKIINVSEKHNDLLKSGYTPVRGSDGGIYYQKDGKTYDAQLNFIQ